MLQILNPSDLTEELTKLYTSGLPAGSRTGWRNVDDLYTVAPGYWTVLTGIPSHGKSTWLDCLLVHLMRQGWKVVIYSPENQPHALHLSSLCEKFLNRPFRFGYNNRMVSSDLASAMDFFESRLRILRFDHGAIFPSLNTFMLACEEVLTTWTDGPIAVVVDPWNELDHTPVGGMNETQYINHELMFYRQWIRRVERLHGFIVAHPQKPQRNRDGEYRDVGLYDINGSAAWYNKCDHGIVVRRRDEEVVIDVEKCRFRHLGKKGTAYLQFNSGTGTYYEQQTGNGRYGRFVEDDDSFRDGQEGSN